MRASVAVLVCCSFLAALACAESSKAPYVAPNVPTAAQQKPVGDVLLPSQELHFVAIGDSITGTGFHAPHGWGNQFAALLGAERVTNLGENGWTTGQLLFAVQYHAGAREALRTANVITVNAGMNEFFMGRDIYSKGDCGGGDGRACLRHMVRRFERWWTALIDEIHTLAPRARLIALNLYHPLEAFDQHFGWDGAVRSHIRAMNEIVAATDGVDHVDIYRSFNGPDGRGDPIRLGYILPDAIHATTAGHTAITGLLARVIAGINPIR